MDLWRILFKAQLKNYQDFVMHYCSHRSSCFETKSNDVMSETVAAVQVTFVTVYCHVKQDTSETLNEKKHHCQDGLLCYIEDRVILNVANHEAYLKL